MVSGRTRFVTSAWRFGAEVGSPGRVDMESGGSSPAISTPLY